MNQLCMFGEKLSDATVDGIYRYDLRRTWGDIEADGIVNFVMLNPSTADASDDDPTIRRCIGFSKTWGYAGLVVTNLYAYRATDPRELGMTADPVGPRNDDFVSRWARASKVVVCAWGSMPRAKKRAAEVLAVIGAAEVHPVAIRLTKDGSPAHPLYLPANLGHVSMEQP